MSFLRMSSGGMQFTSSSYILPLTAKSRLGVCSARMSFAISCRGTPNIDQNSTMETVKAQSYCMGNTVLNQSSMNACKQVQMPPSMLQPAGTLTSLCKHAVRVEQKLMLLPLTSGHCHFTETMQYKIWQHGCVHVASWRAIAQGGYLHVQLPVRHLHCLIILEWVLRHVTGFKAQQCPPQVPF